MKRYAIILVAVLLLALSIPTLASDFTESEPNNNIEQANNISMSQNVIGNITQDDADYFRVDLEESGRLTISFTSYMSFYSVHIFDIEGNELWKSEENELNESVGVLKNTHNVDLEAGAYFLRVTSRDYWGSYTGNYNFTCDFVSANANIDEPNNSITEAKPFTMGSEVFGIIAVNDSEDYYKIDLDESGRVKITFTSYMPFYSLFLFDEEGGEIWCSEENKLNESVGVLSNEHNLDLEAGTYFLRVTSRDYWGSYTGNYNFMPEFIPSNANVDEPNNSIIEAKPFIMGSMVYGVIALNDSEDYYKIDITESGRINIAFTSYLPFYSLHLFDKEGNELWKTVENEIDSSVGVLNNAHYLDLEIGTYFLRVTSRNYWGSYTGNYNFMPEFIPSNANVDEPNNSIAEAKAISTGSEVFGLIALGDAEDYYKFDLEKPGKVQISFTSYMPFYSLHLYDKEGNELWYSAENEMDSSVGILKKTHEIDLEAQTFFLRITSRNYWGWYTGNYNFIINIGDQITHNVTLIDGLTDEIITTMPVVHGMDVEFPVPPTHEGYKFAGWDKDGKNITEDTTITAKYEEEQKIALGDVNEDGRVNTGDATFVLKHIVGKITLSGNNLIAADYNKDGKVNTGDVVAILKFIAAH